MKPEEILKSFLLKIQPEEIITVAIPITSSTASTMLARHGEMKISSSAKSKPRKRTSSKLYLRQIQSDSYSQSHRILTLLIQVVHDRVHGVRHRDQVH